MNDSEIVCVEGKNGAYRLLYTHDDGFTRHVVEIEPDGYSCLINEQRCFTRGTHERMEKLSGVNLNELNKLTVAKHIGLKMKYFPDFEERDGFEETDYEMRYERRRQLLEDFGCEADYDHPADNIE